MHKLVVITLLASFLFLVGTIAELTTKHTHLYLPDAVQGSQPFCVSNRTRNDLTVGKDFVLRPNYTVNVAVARDYQWGFDTPQPSTDRTDVNCFVIQ
jgi:hypothetical protein